MSATIWRDHIVDPVIGNRRPFAVQLDLVMVADHAAGIAPAAVELGKEALPTLSR